jgi:hypothetical protein
MNQKRLFNIYREERFQLPSPKRCESHPIGLVVNPKLPDNFSPHDQRGRRS